MQQTNDRLTTENVELRAEAEAKSADVDRLNALLDKLQEDKAVLSDKVQALQVNGEMICSAGRTFRLTVS